MIVGIEDGEAGRVGRVEAGSADEYVKIMVEVWVAAGNSAVVRNLGDRSIGNGHVGSCERGEVVDTWGWTTTADSCTGNQDAFESWVFELGFHIGCQVGAKLGLGLVAGEEDGEGAVDAGLARLS